MTTTTVVIQFWEESESGWGVRPDGISVHKTEQDRQAFIRRYWDRMPSMVPDEYERPCGDPITRVVGPEPFDAVEATENGIRVYRHDERYNLFLDTAE